MNVWYDEFEVRDHDGIFDPLCVERSAPLEDEEAALIEALCRAATPGPLVVDDEADGDGAVVVALPDGRMIVSLTASVEQARDEGVTHANAQLICKARYLLLRLLRDRRQWKQDREFLLERIRSLEAALESARQETQPTAWADAPAVSAHPR